MIFSVSKAWLNGRTLSETTLVPSSTRKEETWTRNWVIETSVRAVEMAEKSRLSVAWTSLSTLTSAAREVWKAARLVETPWLEGGRALTVN